MKGYFLVTRLAFRGVVEGRFFLTILFPVPLYTIFLRDILLLLLLNLETILIPI